LHFCSATRQEAAKDRQDRATMERLDSDAVAAARTSGTFRFR
jgi:hypothetical protein